VTDKLTVKEHVERIQSAQDQLILRIQAVSNEAVAAIQSDDSRTIKQHLEKLRQHRLAWHADNEQFFGAIEYALTQLGLKPTT
jgi:hypothetical protein